MVTNGLRTGIGAERAPGPLIHDPGAIKQYIPANLQLGNHWVGSAKMGDIVNDPTAVVDSMLRVKGAY